MSTGDDAHIDRLASLMDDWHDTSDEFTAAIDATHPSLTHTYEHDDLARRLITHRHSKGALIDLVRWLISQREALSLEIMQLRVVSQFVLKETRKEDEDAKRYRWALPILTQADSLLADERAAAIAVALLSGLDGDAAIDAARAMKKD